MWGDQARLSEHHAALDVRQLDSTDQDADVVACVRTVSLVCTVTNTTVQLDSTDWNADVIAVACEALVYTLRYSP